MSSLGKTAGGEKCLWPVLECLTNGVFAADRMDAGVILPPFALIVGESKFATVEVAEVA